MEILRRTTLLFAAVILSTCGDPLVSDQYRGEPLFRFSGQVVAFDGVPQAEYNPRLSIFWSKTGRTDVAVDDLVEQPSASVKVSFPSEFEVLIFNPPEPVHMVNASYGLALILIYNDVDDDGWFNPNKSDETIIGGSEERVLVYARKAFDAAQSPVHMSIPAGFSALWLPIECDLDIPPESLEACSPTIGAPCDSAADCGENGVCLREVVSTLNNGYCTFSIDDVPCVHANNTAWVSESVTLRACAVDDDCPRDGEYCLQTQSEEGDLCPVCWPSTVSSPNFISCFQPSSESAACMAEVGRACAADADCEYDDIIGECEQIVAGRGYPGGICDFTYADHPDCTLSNAVYTDMKDTFYLKYCDSNSACRTDEGYVCDGLYHACIPEHPIYLRLVGDVDLESFMSPLCAEDRSAE